MPRPKHPAKFQGSRGFLGYFYGSSSVRHESFSFFTQALGCRDTPFAKALQQAAQNKKPAHWLFANDRESPSEFLSRLLGHSERTRTQAVRRATNTARNNKWFHGCGESCA